MRWLTLVAAWSLKNWPNVKDVVTIGLLLANIFTGIIFALPALYKK